MNDGKKSAYFGLFFVFMNTEETPLSSEGFAVQLQTCLWSEVSFWSVAMTVSRCSFSNPHFHINTSVCVRRVSVASSRRAALCSSEHIVVFLFPRRSASAPRRLQDAGEWEEVVSGRKVRRWRLNGLQEEGREDYSSILLLLSEIKESLRIN